MLVDFNITGGSFKGGGDGKTACFLSFSCQTTVAESKFHTLWTSRFSLLSGTSSAEESNFHTLWARQFLCCQTPCPLRNPTSTCCGKVVLFSARQGRHFWKRADKTDSFPDAEDRKIG